MVASYCVVHILLAKLLCLASYEQWSTQLLKVLHKGCNTEVFRVLLIYPHSPLGAVCPWNQAYILVKSLTAVLQPIVCMYVCMHACMHMCMYVHSASCQMLDGTTNYHMSKTGAYPFHLH